jgi:hypothetical protein
MTIFLIPFCDRASIAYSMMGRFATGIITFGFDTVNGLNLVPSPAARITAFNFVPSYGIP